MTDPDLDAVVADYLRHLDSALYQLPGGRRRQLVAEIAEHLDEARSQLSEQSEVTIRDLLDRTGAPEDIAEEAMADLPNQRQLSHRSRLIPTLAVLVVAAVAVVLAVVLPGSRHTGPGSSSTSNVAAVTIVPDLEGMTAASAANKLAALGLKVATSVENSTVVPSGDVVSQDPVGDLSVSKGSTISLQVSAGPPLSTVANVVGMYLGRASAELQTLGFKVLFKSVPSSNVPQGEVVRQEPTAGSTVARGSSATLQISTGP